MKSPALALHRQRSPVDDPAAASSFDLRPVSICIRTSKFGAVCGYTSRMGWICHGQGVTVVYRNLGMMAEVAEGKGWEVKDRPHPARERAFITASTTPMVWSPS